MYINIIKQVDFKEYNELLFNLTKYNGKEYAYTEYEDKQTKFNNVKYSNLLENIYTTQLKLNNIINNKVIKTSNADDKLISGYNEAYNYILDNYKDISISKETFKEIHYKIFSYDQTKYSINNYEAGKFKTRDNIIYGNNKTIFTTSYKDVELALDGIISKYKDIKYDIHPLIKVTVFIADYLSIHPFIDGNGRTSRLLTILLLLKEDIKLPIYFPIDKVIYNTRNQYYETLELMSTGYNNSKLDVLYIKPLINYYLVFIYKYSYDILEHKLRASYNKVKGQTKDKVLNIILTKECTFNFQDIKRTCFDKEIEVSDISIRKILNQLIVDNKIIKIGNGRNTTYKIN